MFTTFEIISERGPFGDGCSLYGIKPVKEMSVQDLINHALSKTRDWGYVDLGERASGHRLEYRYGTIVSDELTDADKQTKIEQMTAYGGYTRMDYLVNPTNPL